MELYLAMSIVGFFAGGLQGLTGFGTVMVALPLMSLLVDIKTVVPLISLLGLFINTFQTVQLRKQVLWKLLIPLLMGSIIGIPMGAHILKVVASSWLQILFGLILVGFVFFSLYVRPQKRDLGQPWAWGAGILSGILGGSIGANGPPVIVYATLGPWNKDQFKAMLVGYLCVNFVFICSYYTATGVFTGQILGFFAATIPGTTLGILTGTLISSRVGERGFRHMVYLILLILGATLMYKGML